MSVTAAEGFSAAAVAAGLKENGEPDLAIVVNEGPEFNGAAIFTNNRAKANPILWSEQAIRGGIVRAVVLNSGGANCFTGPEGFQLVHATAEQAAKLLGPDSSPNSIQVCSTGIIGRKLPRDPLLAGLKVAFGQLSSHKSAGEEAAIAILTTDSVPKLAEVEIGGGDTKVTIGGMAKGAGMLAPDLATMLSVITTDACLSSDELREALSRANQVSFSRLDSDGCQSTNDQVTLMASGASGIVPSLDEFVDALSGLCVDLARQLLADAEGASHEITISVINALRDEDATSVGRAIARNNLFKAAVFGNDPNWGRILAAIGTTDAAFDVYDVDVSINGVRLCHRGIPDRPASEVDLTPRKTEILVNLRAGTSSTEIWTNDLTEKYVHFNSAHSS